MMAGAQTPEEMGFASSETSKASVIGFFYHYFHQIDVKGKRWLKTSFLTTIQWAWQP
jgi:hypothetical protein